MPSFSVLMAWQRSNSSLFCEVVLYTLKGTWGHLGSFDYGGKGKILSTSFNSAVSKDMKNFKFGRLRYFFTTSSFGSFLKVSNSNMSNVDLFVDQTLFSNNIYIFDHMICEINKVKFSKFK